jgi:hypothetical protein
MKKAMILTCSRRAAYCGGYVQGLLDAHFSKHLFGWARNEHESDIARGRSQLMTTALRSKAESFVWVDDDIHFTKADFDRIVTCPGKVVGGLYVKRCPGKQPVYLRPQCRYHPDEPLMEEVEAIGTGFLRIDRDILETMEPHLRTTAEWHHYFDAGIYVGEYLSEDYAFCRFVRKHCQEPVYVHHGVKVGHEGIAVYQP